MWIITSARVLACRLRRLRRFVRFGLVGVSGVFINEAALAASLAVGAPELVGVVFSTQVSSAWNFLLVERWAFKGEAPRRPAWHRLVMFFAVNNAALLLRGPIIVGLNHWFGMPLLVSNLVSLGVLVVLRFALADVIWKGEASDAIAPEPELDLSAVADADGDHAVSTPVDPGNPDTSSTA